MLAAWWVDLPERYDYETLLFPYLLSGLWDHAVDVQQQVLDALDHIGAEHEKDHFSRLREELLYASRAEAKLPQFSRHLPSVLPMPFVGARRVSIALRRWHRSEFCSVELLNSSHSLPIIFHSVLIAHVTSQRVRAWARASF
jgi:hypothetical protein